MEFTFTRGALLALSTDCCNVVCCCAVRLVRVCVWPAAVFRPCAGALVWLVWFVGLVWPCVWAAAGFWPCAGALVWLVWLFWLVWPCVTFWPVPELGFRS